MISAIHEHVNPGYMANCPFENSKDAKIYCKEFIPKQTKYKVVSRDQYLLNNTFDSVEEAKNFINTFRIVEVIDN
jgi:hypothetical protein